MANRSIAVQFDADAHSVIYFALGLQCWGRATTIEAAIAQAHQHFPAWAHPEQPREFRVFGTTDPKAYVDGVTGDFCCAPGSAQALGLFDVHGQALPQQLPNAPRRPPSKHAPRGGSVGDRNRPADDYEPLVWSL